MFEDLISSWGGTDVFRSALGRKFLRGHVSEEAIPDLATWSDLNELIVTRRLVPPQLRVVNEGRVHPAKDYLDSSSSPRRRQQPTVDPGKLEEILSRGATLVLNDLQEILPNVIDAAGELSDLIGERVQANAYATWGKTHGFDPHWDDHDVLIVQITGQKHWDIFGLGTSSPLDHEVDADNSRPKTPIWSGDLLPGDAIYLPRGWWHAVTGSAEESLHLTFGFQRRTGLDYLRWLIPILEKDPAFREDLPAFDNNQAIQKQHSALRDALNVVLETQNSAKFIHQFQNDLTPPARLHLEHVANNCIRQLEPAPTT